MHIKTYVFTFSLGLLIATCITPLVIIWARRHDFIDQPNARTIHQKPIARIGGIAIIIAVLLAVLPSLAIQNQIGERFRDMGLEIWTLLGTSTFIFFVGLYDDLKHVRVRTKLAAQSLAVVVVLTVGIRIEHITIRDLFSIQMGWLSYPVTAFWIIGVCNAINLIDGLDGLAAGIITIACAVIAILSIWQGNVVLAVLMLALMGALIGFLLFNFHPARIFMGDCGSLFLGFIIATASVITASKAEALVGVGLPMLVLGIPIFDTLLSILRRFLQRRGIMTPDRSHFHHRLLELGFQQHQVAVVAYLVTFGISGLGLFLIVTRGTSSILVLICCLILLLLIFRSIGAIRFHETLEKMHQRSLSTRQVRSERAKYEDVELVLRNAETLDDWWRCLCMAARAMDFVYLTLELALKEEQKHTLYWQQCQQRDVTNYKHDLFRISLSLRDRTQCCLCDVTAGIDAQESLESAGRRGALFSRLLEVYSFDEFIAHHPDHIEIKGDEQDTKALYIACRSEEEVALNWAKRTFKLVHVVSSRGGKLTLSDSPKAAQGIERPK